MPSGDAGAVINVGADGSLFVVWWGPLVRATVDSLDAGGLTVQFLRPVDSARMVETIVGNLTFNDPGFPVTVID